MNRKARILYRRIREDAEAGINAVIARKLRLRGHDSNCVEQAIALADCAIDIAEETVDALLRHYTIRDRKR